MSASTFIPSSDSDKGIWLNNFTVKLPAYASALGITAAEVTSVQKDNAMFAYVLNVVDIYKQITNTFVSYKGLLKHASGQQHLGALPAPPTLPTAPAAVAEGVFDRISMLAKRIKAHPAYTETIGNDLGIIAPVQVIDVNTLQPDLSVRLDAGRPHIKCSRGIADAIDLYVDRRDGAGFVYIGRLLKPDYIDTASLPANTVLSEWDYKAIYVIVNDQVGLMSPVVSVVVKRM